MALRFPCELVNWFVLPAVRRELSIYLAKEKGLSRKKIAELLGLTEAAVCQYVKAKRGKKFDFSKGCLKQIHSIGDFIAAAEENPQQLFISKTCSFCRGIRTELLLCEIHRNNSGKKSLASCAICAKGR